MTLLRGHVRNKFKKCKHSMGCHYCASKKKTQAGSQVSKTNLTWRIAREHKDSRLDPIRTDRHLARLIRTLHVYSSELL